MNDNTFDDDVDIMDTLIELVMRGDVVAAVIPGEDEPRYYSVKHRGNIPTGSLILTAEHLRQLQQPMAS